MAKAGEAAKARTERKANIKQKKKFSNKNSIGKARKKIGSEARYITRTGAVKKLQVRMAHRMAAVTATLSAARAGGTEASDRRVASCGSADRSTRVH